MTMVQGVVIAAIPSILSGLTMLIVTRQQMKAEKRRAAEEEREKLTLEALNAILRVI